MFWLLTRLLLCKCILGIHVVLLSQAPMPLQVLGLTSNVRKMFRDMDEGLYEECRLRYEAEEVRALSSLSYSLFPLLEDALGI